MFTVRCGQELEWAERRLLRLLANEIKRRLVLYIHIYSFPLFRMSYRTHSIQEIVELKTVVVKILATAGCEGYTVSEEIPVEGSIFMKWCVPDARCHPAWSFESPLRWQNGQSNEREAQMTKCTHWKVITMSLNCSRLSSVLLLSYKRSVLFNPIPISAPSRKHRDMGGFQPSSPQPHDTFSIPMFRDHAKVKQRPPKAHS